MNKSLLKAVAVCVSFAASSYATVLVQGNASTLNTLESTNPNAATLTFTQGVTAKAYDRNTGTLYLGLANGIQPVPGPITIGPAGEYAISKVTRPVAGSTQNGGNPSFTPIALNTNLQQTAIDQLALSHSPGLISPVLVILPSEAPGLYTDLGVYFSSPDGTVVQQSSQILAANQQLDANGAPGVVVNIAANDEFAFAATASGNNDFIVITTTRDIESITETLIDSMIETLIDSFIETILETIGEQATGFGANGSGIAVIAYDELTLLPQQTAAQPGDTGIKAAELDARSPFVSIGGFRSQDIVKNRVSLFWDQLLQRLYIGFQATTQSVASRGLPGDGVRSVVVSSVDQDGVLTYYPFVDGTTLTPGDDTKLVAVRQVDMTMTETVSANQLHVMHCSTGPSYLIVNGGNGSYTTDSSMLGFSDFAVGQGTTGNNIWAIPLVDVGDPSNPNQGKEADKYFYNATTHRFEVPASDSDLTASYDPFAQVGQGPIPVQPDVPVWGMGQGTPSTRSTLDIVVDNDTVYVAIGTSQNAPTDDTGVFYSQAVFDSVGKISHWTPWAKRALPYYAFADLPTENSTVRFIAVDAVTGKLWAVDDFLRQSVVITGWNSGIFSNPLSLAINQSLTNGCYSVLDLDQTTTQLGSNSASRYALFGGINKVDFVQTASSLIDGPPYNFTTNNAPAPQLIFDTFTSGGPTFLETKLPEVAGAVNVLEFSRQPANSFASYFFAGTNAGLFVYSQDGNGFDVTQMGALNQPPFTVSSWEQITAIAGDVVDIKTSGQKLYIIARAKVNGKYISTLYSIAFASTISAMFNPANINIIAQSGVNVAGSDLSNTLNFYGMQVLVLNAQPGTYDEQIVLATNQGLFASQAAGGVQTATNQSSALFNRVGDNALTVGIAGIDTPAPTTAWPFTLVDPSKQGLFNRSAIRQVNGNQSTVDQFDFVPAFFNADVATPGFATLSPINEFWSDGNRRMFAVSSSICPANVNALQSAPFNASAWNLQAPYNISDTVVAQTNQLNWIKQIGSTGLLLVGTNNGVISLQ